MPLVFVSARSEYAPDGYRDVNIPGNIFLNGEEETRVIEFRNISKTYRVVKRQAGFGNAVKSFFSREYTDIHALNDVSFTVGDGEIVGYIGPNGAGKSTTIKVMCGVLTPDNGECVINGRIPYKERIAHVKEIGVVFGQRSQLWWDVPVIDSFELLRDIYRIDGRIYRKNVDRLTQLLDLGELLKTPARNLSLGQRMRCEIAASLLHDPKVLFLDEPTIGLDAVSKIAVRRFIKEINAEQKVTVVLTTHDMQDIEALVSRILLIGKGRILMDGSLEELKRHAGSQKTLTVEHKGEIANFPEGMVKKEEKNGKLILSLDPEVLAVSEAVSYLASRTELLDITVSDLSAEEIVAKLYTEYRI